jgi:hypothetical protein
MPFGAIEWALSSPLSTRSASKPLPSDIEHAAVEQLAFWFMNREKQGIKTNWPKDSVYQQFATQDLLESVTAVLGKHRRWTLQCPTPSTLHALRFPHHV